MERGVTVLEIVDLAINSDGWVQPPAAVGIDMELWGGG
jgi:hypothetical protein